MAENKTININIKQNADKAEQSFKSYNKELGNTKKQYDAVLKSGKPFDQQLEDINKIVKETPLNVRDMNKQIQAYQSIALSAGRETPVGRKALEEAAALRDRYVDIQNETKRLADDQRTLEGAMQGVATGVAVFGGVQSAMALSGVESEKLRETLVKLQAAQTLMNSINQISTALEKESALMLTLKDTRTKALTLTQSIYTAVTGKATQATKLFKVALASTGIGILVVAVGALIANFDKVLKLFSPIIDGLKSMGDAIGLTNFAEEEQNQERKRRAEEQRMRIEAERKQRDNAFKQRQGQFDREIALLEAEGKSTVELTKQKIESSIAYQKEKIKEIQLELKGLKVYEDAFQGQSAFAKQAREDARKLREEREAEILELNNNISDSENQLKINVINNNKKKAASYKSYAQERENIARKIQDLENQLLEDGIEKDLELNRVKFERLREQVKGNSEEQIKQRELYTQLELEAETKIRLKYFKQEKELLSGIVDFKDELRNKDIENNKKAAISIVKTNEKARKKDLADEKAVADAKESIRDAQIANVEAGIALLKDVAGENNKLQALAIAAENAVGIAKIIISTQAANAAAKLKYAAIPGGLALAAAEITANKISAGIGIAASVAAAAKGIASLKSSAPLDSGGDLGGGGVGSEAVAPEFNVVGDSGVNQLAQLQQQPTQAYVVSGEVTSAQALDRNRITNATL